MIRNAVLACHGVGLSSTACANAARCSAVSGAALLGAFWSINPPAAAAHRQHPGEGARPRLPRKRMLESGRFASLAELAEHEKIDRSYLCRVLRLTLLAPEIVEAILEGRQPEDVTLPVLMKPVPVEWERQRAWRAT